ncbi:MAG: response regulator [Desulfuromonadaceae bacterium]|nr:response regulator [Desulfuromonadaceae bacterium]MDD2856626.1 response regulator [Desulfuromonadaceae bacterium]
MRKKKVLIVEDEESLLKLETILLTVKGFEVISAFTGEMAVAKIGVESFDLVLLDIMLPDMDGFEVCRQLRQDPRTAKVPIIMLTGKKLQEDREKGILCGADSYLVKPFKSAMIIDEINLLLTRCDSGE